MKEADLYPTVKTWLEKQGLKVYPEVPIHNRAIDVVGIGLSETVGVEMKLHMSEKVIYQANGLALSCNRSYVAVGSNPRTLDRCRQLGIGVLRILGESVVILLESKHSITPSPHYWEMVRQKCSRMSGTGVGGVPCLDGMGPAQQCRKLVDLYLKANPKADWHEIYSNVPNHYASAKSMRGALVQGLRRRAFFKKLRREQASADGGQ